MPTMARNAQYLINEAARILRQANQGRRTDDDDDDDNNHNNDNHGVMGLRTLLYASSCPKPMVPLLTAMVNGTHANYDTLWKVAQEAEMDIQGEEDEYEMAVCLYECLLGSRRIRGTSETVQHVKRHKAILQQTLAAQRKRGGTNASTSTTTMTALSAPRNDASLGVATSKASNRPPPPPRHHHHHHHHHYSRIKLPRYCRVNTLLCTLEEAIEYMESFGLRRVEITTNQKYNQIELPSSHTFAVDPYIPNLLILPPGTNLHGDEWVDAGKLVLQDRASCLTATVLRPPVGSVCLDTCAAPGNKTSHVASLVVAQPHTSPLESPETKSGHVVALERSKTRYNTLCNRMEQFGCKDSVKVLHADAMHVDLANDPVFRNVTHALLDPSCSGSGLATNSTNGSASIFHAASRTHHQDDDGDDTMVATQVPPDQSTTVQQLASSQIALLLRVMQELPNLQVVAYSTCSVYREENEDVVAAVLGKMSPAWELVTALPAWPHRGLSQPATTTTTTIPCDNETQGSAPDNVSSTTNSHGHGQHLTKIGSAVIRASPLYDSTSGFFVARFEKKRPPSLEDPAEKGSTDSDEPARTAEK
eukprot:scaffold35061_cov214-Amphora_coffeaeformis.AAC.2